MSTGGGPQVHTSDDDFNAVEYEMGKDTALTTHIMCQKSSKRNSVEWTRSIELTASDYHYLNRVQTMTFHRRERELVKFRKEERSLIRSFTEAKTTTKAQR